MEIDFILEKYQIDKEKKQLQLRLGCGLPKQAECSKIRLSVIFRGKSCDRHYPAVAERGECTDGVVWYHAQFTVQLEYVFFDRFPDAREPVEMRAAYCDLEEQWIVSAPLLELSGSLFGRGREKGASVPAMLWNWCRYILDTVFLPVWLFDGWLAVKRGRGLHPAAAGRGGKSAYLYHAHGLVKDRTGHGYSVREYKTNYFRACYDRACRGIARTEGIVLLSERCAEEGGNLDLVRRELDKGGYPYQEFLTTKPVHKLSRKQLRHCAGLLAGARLVILEDFVPQLHALSVRKDTEILQLWHACGAFKLFGLSELGIVNHLKQSSPNHRCYTAAITSSRAVVPFYSEAFGIPQERVHPVGIPRTDIFFDRDYRIKTRKRLLEKYPVCEGKRVILFAPTFRGSGNKTAYYPMERFSVDDMMESFPEDTVLIIKHHPFVSANAQTEQARSAHAKSEQAKSEHAQIEKYGGRVLDLSVQEGINDLLFITSLLITDYSSVIFEATLLQLPILFYAFDLEEYLAARNFYFDFSGFVPGVIVKDAEELVREAGKALGSAAACVAEEGEAVTGHRESGKREAFRHLFLDALDGHSTERVMSLIKELLK